MLQSQQIYGLAHWMRYALEHEGNLQTPYAELIAQAEKDPDNAAALLDMSTIMLMSKQRAAGLDLQLNALQMKTLYTIPSKKPSALSILVFMFPGELMQNTPVDCLLENSDVTLHLLYIAPYLQLPESLPEHDLAFVAIGQSSASLEILETLQPILSEWEKPVINFPLAISQLTREATYQQLKNIPGVIAPYTFLSNRAELESYDNLAENLKQSHPKLKFPIVIRPRDSHAGEKLSLLNHPSKISSYLLSVLTQEFYISNFVDYQDSNGVYTKYRIVFIDKKPYVCHIAMNNHWVIHYANAGMDESAAKRAQEDRLMQTFETEFVPRHQKALQAIAEQLNLDYVGIDCAETQDGQLVVFEADTSIIVHNFDDETHYGYKQPVMEKVFQAFRSLLNKKLA